MAKIIEEKILIKFSMMLPESAESNFTLVTEDLRKNLEDCARTMLADALATMVSENEENMPMIIVEAVIVDHEGS